MDPSKIAFYTSAGSEPQYRIECLLGGKATGGSEFIETTGGGGIWEEVVRPYLPPLVIWRGPKEAYKHKIPLLFDGFESLTDVSADVSTLEHMAGMYTTVNAEQFTLQEPVKLKIDGEGAIFHDVTAKPDFDWVIATPPEWGEQVRMQDGTLIRQAVTVTFMLHTPWPLMPETPGEPPGGFPNKFILANGKETFEQIAAKTWKKHPHWGTKLAKFNHESNGADKPKQGTKVYFPTKKQEDEWARGKNIKDI